MAECEALCGGVAVILQHRKGVREIKKLITGPCRSLQRGSRQTGRAECSALLACYGKALSSAELKACCCVEVDLMSSPQEVMVVCKLALLRTEGGEVGVGHFKWRGE